MTVRELYEQSIRQLSAADRYELATIILGEISRHAVIDYQDHWTEEDLKDFTRHSWSRIEVNPEYDYDG